jgi:uncharacterized protein YcbK (DUF882 family)
MTDYTRRNFIKFGVGALAASIVPFDAWAAVSKRVRTERTLSFYNTHTGENLGIRYFKDGVYRPEALKRINFILRDHRTDSVKPIDPRLLDILYTLKYRVRPSGPFHIISGYRSPLSNRMLRAQGRGVASNSLHTQGRAIDIRLPGYSTARLRKLCVGLRTGGIGYYPRSDFLHLDTGEFRTW